ncbi:hypothetical protein HPB50_018227 [Hyalomma asiaticum]|uniref:Uncharacterized protein n=1 Tax=Hyalomma asiaticum TaxID=266040 RepID=A0ACB7SRC3_HYAAI|nr:hypothetical protein HPB50_018227 [Hyalomma asiaticum]
MAVSRAALETIPPRRPQAAALERGSDSDDHLPRATTYMAWFIQEASVAEVKPEKNGEAHLASGEALAEWNADEASGGESIRDAAPSGRSWSQVSSPYYQNATHGNMEDEFLACSRHEEFESDDAGDDELALRIASSAEPHRGHPPTYVWCPTAAVEYRCEGLSKPSIDLVECEGSQSLRISRKYVKVGIIVYFVIVPVVSSIAISHVWAVGNTDVTFFLPYIRIDGAGSRKRKPNKTPPFVWIPAAIVTFSLRYVTVMDISKAKNMPGYVLLLNYFNFLAGIGIFFGLILVAMNPTGHLRRDGTWLSPIFVPHVIGASVLFASGLVYMLVNALLTLCLVDQYRNYGVLKARVVIFAFDLVACALSIL